MTFLVLYLCDFHVVTSLEAILELATLQPIY